jgi:hypothetical protein
MRTRIIGGASVIPKTHTGYHEERVVAGRSLQVAPRLSEKVTFGTQTYVGISRPVRIRRTSQPATGKLNARITASGQNHAKDNCFCGGKSLSSLFVLTIFYYKLWNRLLFTFVLNCSNSSSQIICSQPDLSVGTRVSLKDFTTTLPLRHEQVIKLTRI